MSSGMQTRSKTNPNPNPIVSISRYDTENPPEESDEIKAAVREEANRMFGDSKDRSPSHKGSEKGGRKSRRKNRNKKRRTRRYSKKRSNKRR